MLIEWPTEDMLRARISSDTSKVIIVHQPYNVRGAAHSSQDPILEVGKHASGAWKNVTAHLDRLTDMYKDISTRACSGCPVEIVSGSIQEDFALMVTAPVLICTGSTFCMWAAMANPYTSHVCSTGAGGAEPPVNSNSSSGNFHWMTGGISNKDDYWMFKDGFKSDAKYNSMGALTRSGTEKRAAHDIAFVDLLLRAVPSALGDGEE